MTRTTLDSSVANWPLTLLLTWGVIFCVLVCGKYAKFICLNHDGATVTQRFDYIKEPHFFAGFFWRYEHLDRRQRGYDTSVSSVPPEDIQQIQHFESRFAR
jgi:hypothetical protein